MILIIGIKVTNKTLKSQFRRDYFCKELMKIQLFNGQILISWFYGAIFADLIV